MDLADDSFAKLGLSENGFRQIVVYSLRWL
jgi:hypothetical protein